MAGSSATPGHDVVVLVGSRWATLAKHGTRWRAVLTRWAEDPRLRSLTVIDYPGFTARAAVRPALARWAPSWHPRIRLVQCQVPALKSSSPLDALAWRRAGRALDAVLSELDGPPVAVATTPLWAPVLGHLSARRTGFDAVDDWRGYAATRQLSGHVERGYRATRSVDVVTAVSPEMTRRLWASYAVPATTVPNGVDVSAFEGQATAPPGLPTGPFAVYVGVVEERVDIDLLGAVVRALPDLQVVVAGPARSPYQERLQASGALWLGPVDVALIPGLLQRAAVGLVPHVVNDFTASMNPMKVLEYLAAGLPVVSTRVPGIGALSARITLADRADFVDAVAAARLLPRLERGDPAVRDRDWSGVADRLLELHLGGGG